MVVGTFTSLYAVIRPHDNILSINSIGIIEIGIRIVTLEANMLFWMPFSDPYDYVEHIPYILLADLHSPYFIHFRYEFLTVLD